MLSADYRFDNLFATKRDDKDIAASVLLGAVMFAAKRHNARRFKEAATSPSINYPNALAQLLASVGQVEDVDVLRPAILHDTIEDIDTSEAELRGRFGNAVGRYCH